MAKRLRSVFGSQGKYIYMGSNPAEATHALPTTRAWIALKRALGRSVHRSGPPDVDSRPQAPESTVGTLLQHVKSLLALAMRVGDDAYRLLLAELLARVGYVVILDRHPYADYYAHRVAARDGWLRWGDRLHGFLLDRAYPRPDPVVLFDAPAEVLLRRKPEGTRQALEARREEYRLVARHLPNVVVLDATRSEGEVWASLLQVSARLLTDGQPWGQFAAAGPGPEGAP
jgi:thymidylate kinase